MTGFRRSRIPLVIAATLCLGAVAWAEGIFQVNDPGNGNWVFDQPSVVANGTVLHVAFVGDNAISGSTNTRLYYAAVNGAADFTNKLTADNQVRLTAPVAIDNDSLYTNARHPQIALRSANELAILFQAIPVGDNSYKLFRALVTIANNAVTSRRIDRILDASGNDFLGALTDPSFALVTADNTMRVAFSSYPSMLAPQFSDVYYARVALDNARVSDNTLIRLTTASSVGKTPLPRLLLDGNRYSHVAWAANDNTTNTPTGIYYAMVNAIAPSVVDNLAIGATQVLSGGYRWGFPNVLLANTSNYLWILAADDPFGSTGLAGPLGITEINPYAVTHDGNPVTVKNVTAYSLFFIIPPGGSVLSTDFDAYRPEAWVDGQDRMHVAGYGFRSSLSPYQGTPGRYYAMSVGSASSSVGTASVFASMVSSPVTIGLGDNTFAMQIAGDYTRPAFAHLNGKAVHFWSGPDNVLAGDDGARNLYVTSTLDSPDNAPTKQHGCSMVDDPHRGEAERIPGVAVLLLPAAFLALRRAARKAFER
ncbi:MAG: hypothetical protein PHP88_04665 [bacterium]|nr:hypothetical protein [bacterium]